MTARVLLLAACLLLLLTGCGHAYEARDRWDRAWDEVLNPPSAYENWKGEADGGMDRERWNERTRP